MGIYSGGILGTFRNKVGSVVGTSWRGRDVMRVYTDQVANPNTPQQVQHRTKFSVVSKFVAAVAPAVNVGYALVDASLPGRSNAFKKIFANFVAYVSSAPTIDYANVQLSTGIADYPTSPSAVQGTGHSIDVSWTDNSSTSRYASANDVVYCTLFNENKNMSVVSNYSVRSSEEDTIAYPANWQGDKARVYLFTRSPKGEYISPTWISSQITLG